MIFVHHFGKYEFSLKNLCCTNFKEYDHYLNNGRIHSNEKSIKYFFTLNFSFQHFLPDDDPNQLTAEAVVVFLDEILAGTAPVYGGSSYTVR